MGLLYIVTQMKPPRGTVVVKAHTQGPKRSDGSNASGLERSLSYVRVSTSINSKHIVIALQVALPMLLMCQWRKGLLLKSLVMYDFY